MLSRTTKVVIFIIVASIANILLMGLIFLGLMSLYLIFIAPLLPVNVNTIFGLLLFCASVVLTYIIYQQCIKRYGKQMGIQNIISK